MFFFLPPGSLNGPARWKRRSRRVRAEEEEDGLGHQQPQPVSNEGHLQPQPVKDQIVEYREERGASSRLAASEDQLL
jgi:hypothetical protein